MSESSQPEYGSRITRRSLRERELELATGAQPVAEVSDAPEPVVEVEPAFEVVPVTGDAAIVTETPVADEVSSFDEVNTAPTASAPISRVVRRSTTKMAPRNTQPPTPAVIQSAQSVVSPVIANPVGTNASSVFEPVVVAEAPAPVVALGVPPWEAITSGSHPESLDVSAGQPAKLERHALRSAEAERVPPPSAGYTWVQYLILVAVAFVLGLLLWQLIIGEISLPHNGGNILGLGVIAGLTRFTDFSGFEGL